MMSPTWMTMRNRICSPAGRPAISLAMASCTATAHCTASTALAKSARTLSQRVEDSTAMRGNQVIDDGSVTVEGPERADLISLHESAVAFDIGCEDRGGLPFDGV